MMKHIFTVLLLSVFFSFWFWFFGGRWSGNISYISPLPDFLTLGKNRQVTFLDLWFPFLAQSSLESGQAYGSGFDAAELTARSVLVYDLSSNRALFEKNPKTRLPMASLTKIMTAIISLENKRSDDSYKVNGADLVGEDSMGLTEGEMLSQEELLYGLMLKSGNDTAEVLARGYPHGGRESFIQAMNDKAKALGLTDTYFDNPTGLQGDGEQYTTAYDLLVITRYALENFPLFSKIVSTARFDIQETSRHKAYSLESEVNLLQTYPGVKGVKTGYTPEAGLCLITYLDYEGHKIIAIILNSEDRRGEMRELLDNALKTLGIDPPAYSG
jgi:D-alanyl-D-alanine carboxypeptidase